MRYPILGIMLVSACGNPQSTPVPVQTAIRTATGAEVGQVTLREKGDRIQVHVVIQGLPPGQHGMHLHETAKCDPPGFQSAGGHYNPTHMQHGAKNPQGAHLGDLGNLSVTVDGRAETTREIVGPEARTGIKTLLGQTGLALVIHQGPDDEITDPSGNSGARIACAAILP